MDDWSKSRKGPALGMLLMLVLLVYSNTFEASWHLDDYPNIVHNPRVHLRDLQPASMTRALFIGAGDDAQVNRPLARLSLALNWYWGADDVSGYHLVNIAIHGLTACLLFGTIVTLYRSPRLRGEGPDRAHAVALLGALLWALNPIQTQAVTYIVQRMATLAALFYVLGMLLYLKGRLAGTPREAGAFFAGCGVSFVLALASKENALLLPAALILVDVIFFQDLADPVIRRRLIVAALAVSLVLGVIGLALVWQRGSADAVFHAYEQRSFSLGERLLTQPRVLLLYLRQLFYPVPSRLSIEHDVTLSSGLLTPWATLPALLLIAALIGFGLAQLQKRPWPAFALLFFFLNHVIESSVLPLEMVFEHRNYLPSFFLFVPVAALLQRGIDHYRSRQTLVYTLFAVSLPILVMALGVGTYVRNAAWATEKTLWEDAQVKAPRAARPYYNLAKYHFKPKGMLDEALAAYQRAYGAEAAFPRHSQALALNGMAGIYYHEKNYTQVITLCRQALEHNPDFASAWHNIALAGIHLGHWDIASEALDHLLSREPARQLYLNWKALVLIRQTDYGRALAVLQRALRHNAFDYTSNLYLGALSGLMGHVTRGEWFLRQALALAGSRTWPLLHLMENRVMAGDTAGVRRYTAQLLQAFSVKELETVLDGTASDHFSLPMDRARLYAALAAELDEKAGVLFNFTTRTDGRKS